ncbi:MAG: hypothetical protein HXL77_02905 [[Eubacterium] sulci]|nr:hypothetical protein [[Eubacterium] sulci]
MRNEIEMLAREELESANKKFPLFHGSHEGFAVLLEEAEELAEELDEIEKIMNSWWMYLRRDENIDVQKKRVDKIRRHAVNAAMEAIQVIAMCDKFKMSL